MSSLYLISKCQSDYDAKINPNNENTYLTIKGIKQAKRIGEFLKNQDISSFTALTSPFSDCLQTATAIYGINPTLDFKVESDLGFALNKRVDLYSGVSIYPCVDFTIFKSCCFLPSNFDLVKNFLKNHKDTNVIAVTHPEVVSKIIEILCNIKKIVKLGSVYLVRENQFISENNF